MGSRKVPELEQANSSARLTFPPSHRIRWKFDNRAFRILHHSPAIHQVFPSGSDNLSIFLLTILIDPSPLYLTTFLALASVRCAPFGGFLRLASCIFSPFYIALSRPPYRFRLVDSLRTITYATTPDLHQRRRLIEARRRVRYRTEIIAATHKVIISDPTTASHPQKRVHEHAICSSSLSLSQRLLSRRCIVPFAPAL